MSKQNKGSCPSHQGFNSEGAVETCRRTVAFRARCNGRFRQPQTLGRERQESKFKITLAI